MRVTRQQNTSAVSVSPLRAFDDETDLYGPGAQTRSRQLIKENQAKNLLQSNGGARVMANQTSSVSPYGKMRERNSHSYVYQQNNTQQKSNNYKQQSTYGGINDMSQDNKRLLAQHQRNVQIIDATKHNQYAALAKNKNNCRSIGRIGKLIVANHQGHVAKEDEQKLKQFLQSSQENNSCKKMNMEKSQCSSATTAFTMANFQPSSKAQRNTRQSQMVQQDNQTKFKDQNDQNLYKILTRQQMQMQNKLVGKKRQSQQPIEQLETESRLQITLSKTQTTKHSQNIGQSTNSRNAAGVDICSPGSIMDIDIQEQNNDKDAEMTYYTQVQSSKVQNKFSIAQKSPQVQCYTQNCGQTRQRKSGRSIQPSHNQQVSQRQPRSKSHNMIREQQKQEVAPKNQGRLHYSVIKLLNKKTGDRKRYKLYDEDDLNFLKARNMVPEMTEDGKVQFVSKYILDFNMKKLELEYDYDTDDEQLIAAKEMLMEDNFEAIQYCVHKDPLDLVGNLNSELSQDY